MILARRTALTTCALVTMAACASSMPGTIGSDIDVIQREQILATARGNAYDVISQLRPQWLRMRSDQSVVREGGIVVYVDNVRFGDLDSLRIISAESVYVMERFNTTEASRRWGPGHSEGVILVTTRPGFE